jgi:hypothetical protein
VDLLTTGVQEQQKNIMEFLGYKSNRFKYSKTLQLAGAGTQTAALAFGGVSYTYRSNRRI